MSSWIYNWVHGLFGKKSLSVANLRKEKINRIKRYCVDIPDKGKELLYNLNITRRDGFNDYTLITQAWHESAGFMGVAGKWNLWGIKKPRNWTGRTLKIRTHEYVKGKKVYIYDYFIDFKNVQEALRWWKDFIKRVYYDAYLVRDNPPDFFEKLVDKKSDYPGDPDFRYATDPGYSEKLLRLYRQLKEDSRLTKVLKLI